MTVSLLFPHAHLLRAVFLAVALSCAALAAGCGSTPEIDWTQRYNVYTYDDAVRDYGEPTACAGEENGGRICSWKVSGSFHYRDQTVMKFDAMGRLLEHRLAKIR
ncbi:hypothetical protein [Megalodesulfovibrio paquesii]